MDRLSGVHADLVGKVQRVLTAMAALGHPMVVTDGVRTDARQAELYAQGRTAPGRIVTHADGVTVRSRHQISLVDGLGRAVDCAFLDADGRPSWAEHHPWALYGQMAEVLGLVWGGRWQKLRDRPHVELP